RSLLSSSSLPPRRPHPCPTRRSSDLGLALHGPVVRVPRQGALGEDRHTGAVAELRGGDLERLGRLRRLAVDRDHVGAAQRPAGRSEEHTSDSSHVKISYAVFCLKKKK